MNDIDKISRLRITDKDTPATSGGRRRAGRVVAFLLVVAVLAGLLVGWRQGLFSPATQVRVTTVGWVYHSQILGELSASGYVVAQRRAAVSSKGTGRLSYLGIYEGKQVKEGEVLARLENEDLLAEKKQAQAQLASARSELSSVGTDLRTAERHLTRYSNLWEQKAVSRTDFENAQDRLKKATLTVESAQANIRALEAALRRISVLIDYTEIRAPFDGVVLTKDADVGEVVAPFGSAASARAAVATMADMSSLLVEADVAEGSLSRVRIDQPCEIQLDALPDARFPGKVKTVVPTADRARGTVQAKVAFVQLDPRILPEMSAKVTFLTRPMTEEEAHPFLGVHRDAITTRDNQSGYFRIDGDRAVWVGIPGTAASFGDYVVVASVAKAGDRVVVSPPAGLRDGGTVKLPE